MVENNEPQTEMQVRYGENEILVVHGASPADVPYIGLAAALGVGSDRLAEANVRHLNEGYNAPAAQAPGGKVGDIMTMLREYAPYNM